MQKGIGFHHSGMIPILKELIEILFAKGLLKILFVTETFAVGLNMPTRTVVFTSLKKPTKSNKRLLLPHEYNQMSGRAGRRGIDEKGNVIILPIYNLNSCQEANSIMSNNQKNIQSQFSISYKFLLEMFLSEKYTVNSFLKESLFNIELNTKIKTLNDNYLNLTKTLPDINIEDKDLLLEYYEMENKLTEYQELGFTLKLTKKQRKKQYQFKNKIKTINNFNSKYNTIKNYKQINKELIKIKKEIKYYETLITNESNILINVLYTHEFIESNNLTDITYKQVTPKGIIASQINECNSLLLSEMLISGLLDDLTSQELVSLLAIFIPDVRHDIRKLISEVTTPNVIPKLYGILDIVTSITNTEKDNGIIIDENYWDVAYDYIDATYHWVNGNSFMDSVNKLGYDEYSSRDGNFIKNMFKLNNIVNDLLCLCKICNNEKLIPILQNIEPILIRNEVNNRSLYL